MVSLSKLCRVLSIPILFLVTFEPAELTAETRPKKVSDNEVLKLIGAEPVPADPPPKSAPARKQPSSESGLAQPTKKFKIHTVKSGETLGIISRSYYGDAKKVALIAEYNNIKNIDQIHIGQKIKIPALMLKKPKEEIGLKQADLAETQRSTAGPIEETDINRQGLFSIPTLMLIVMIFLFGVLIFLLIKLRGLKGPADKVKIEAGGPFTMGEVDAGTKATEVWRYTRKS